MIGMTDLDVQIMVMIDQDPHSNAGPHPLTVMSVAVELETLTWISTMMSSSSVCWDYKGEAQDFLASIPLKNLHVTTTFSKVDHLMQYFSLPVAS